MSKKSKKTKFNKVEVTWQEDDSMLPTVASAIPQRRDRGFGMGGGGGFGRRDYGNKPLDDASERGPWRRGPSSQPSVPSNSFNSNSFTSNRNTSRNNNNQSFNSFRSSNTRSPSNEAPDDINASDNDRNWRNSKKKEQPKISLNSTISSSNNINPWRSNNNNNNNNNNNTDMQGGSGRNSFGSKSVSQSNVHSHIQSPSSNMGSFSRNSFGSRSSNTFSDNNNNNNGNGGGGGGRYGASKFGGGGSKFGGSASTSKFNTGGGFGAAALKNIDNGTTRLSYSRNNRFSGIMDDNKPEKNVRLEAPSKSVNNRFSMPVSSSACEETAFPGLSSANGQRMRKEKTVEELNKEIKKDIARSNIERNKIEIAQKTEILTQKSGSGKQSKSQSQSAKKNKIDKKVAVSVEKKINEQKKETEGKKQIAKVDKKLVRKFNREHLGQNKWIEINGDTERLIISGLSQKENILCRNEENYEKIANLLCSVILNDKKSKKKSKNKMDLDLIYNIIYNKTLLSVAKKEFLALILEILSLIEIKKSCLTVVYMIDMKDMLNKYLMKTPNIMRMTTMKEFEEYGLQYIYPLQKEIINVIHEKIESAPTLIEIINLLQQIKKKQIIYSNYKSLHKILTYVVSTFYFEKISENEEKNEEIAKDLIIGDMNEKKGTFFTQIIALLHCKHEEDEKNDEEDEEEDDGDIDSHSLLILSEIISISSENKNNHNGLISILKIMELKGLISYKTIQKFVQCDDDKYTKMRLNALSKLTDWIVELDARQARIEMEKDNEDSDEDENVDNTYAGNLLAQRKHKTAADYEQISYIDVE